jgi:predicted nucleotidyltransferase
MKQQKSKQEKMRADKSAILDYLQEIKPILDEKHISVVGFFGSFARDEATVYSDIDIAVKKDEEYLRMKTAYDYFDDVTFIKNLIIKKFHRNADIFDIDSHSSFKNEILREMIHV